MIYCVYAIKPTLLPFIVLSNPAKRVIYDTYGEEGLNASWDVGPRYKTPEEVNNKKG